MENRTKIKPPELLAPVQNWKTLKYIKNIPDSIYFGLEDLNMRRKAKNFKKEELGKIIEYCHSQEPPLNAYLCTNILIYNSELQELKDLIRKAKEADIDAIIAHDIAAIKYAREIGIDFHISTQANISNITSAKFYESLGAERIILARELSLKQIKEIKKRLSKTKIECFIHGSMCTSISGRCYLSASIEGSSEYSANRGVCSQPCRREWRLIDDQKKEFIYDGKMFLNAKDLCMIEYIPELIEANIDAFKIEGRMKNPLYVRTVCECYRKAINSYFDSSYTQEKIKNWMKILSKIYNRGYHTGFYFQKPSPSDIQLEKRGNVSPWKKQYIGRVLSYHESSKTANILVENNKIIIEKKDDIFIENKGLIKSVKIKKILAKGENLNSINLANRNEPLEINISIEKKVKPGDKIFNFSKKPKVLN